MNTDTRKQIETALRAFSGVDLRAAAIGLLNSLGYQSKKTLDLDNTPDAFLAEFDKRDRKFRNSQSTIQNRYDRIRRNDVVIIQIKSGLWALLWCLFLIKISLNQ